MRHVINDDTLNEWIEIVESYMVNSKMDYLLTSMKGERDCEQSFISITEKDFDEAYLIANQDCNREASLKLDQQIKYRLGF
jgi:hypothetical protein